MYAFPRPSLSLFLGAITISDNGLRYLYHRYSMAQHAPDQAVASASAPAQAVASTSAPSGMEETEQSQLTLPILLDTIVESYESQRVQLADACRQIDEIILSTENLTDSQRNALRDRYIASVEDAAARRVLAIGPACSDERPPHGASPSHTGEA